MKHVCLVLFFVLFIFFGCKASSPGSLLYSGRLDGNFKSSSDLVRMFMEAKECMGIKESIDYPKLKVYDGNSVQCGKRVASGCFDGEYVLLPKKTDIGTIKEEFIHYLLFKTTGDLDANHESPYFNLCTSIELVGETK